MPIVIGGVVLGAVALAIYLLSGSAAAAEAGSRKVTEKKPILNVKIKLPERKAAPPAESLVTPTPTPGHFYRIVKGDIGSALCVKAYGGARPTARWYHVAGHPANTVRLARGWSDWFLPRWAPKPAPVYSDWTGVYTGLYATVFFPLESEVPV
jgi:hypothetical protein